MSERSKEETVEETEPQAAANVTVDDVEAPVEETNAQVVEPPTAGAEEGEPDAEEGEPRAEEDKPDIEEPADDVDGELAPVAEEAADVAEATGGLTLEQLEPKTKLSGTVNRLELYGAFIDIGIGTNALIHISQLGAERVNRVSDVLKVGDEVTVWVEKADVARQQVMVTMVEPLAVDWRDLKSGQVRHGTVTRLEDFGAFINIGAEREGLVHISELSHEFVKHPGEVLTVGQEVDVKVLGFSRRKRRIDLSLKALVDAPEKEEPKPKQERRKGQRRRQSEREEQMPMFDAEELEEDNMPTAMEIAMRKAMGDEYPGRAKGSGRKRGRRAKMRRQQEDLLNRTLEMQRDS
jgi:predicted RNA-binding protein with RPS1 domain